MKQNVKLVILFSITIIGLYSCTSMGKIVVQECVPPMNQISSNIQSIAIINRSLTPNFILLGQDSISIEKRLGNNNVNFTRTFFDSIAADTAINVAAKALFDS